MNSTVTRIYYTGDTANRSGWFTAPTLADGSFKLTLAGHVKLTEADGERGFTVCPVEIGNVYHGHGRPRFVTEAAFLKYREANAAELREFQSRMRAQS